MKAKNFVPCRDCGELLSVDADRCGACGWTKPGARKRGEPVGPRHSMGCTWHSGSLFCQFPCALFEEGRTSGFCLFHRRTPDGGKAAQIAEDSHHVSREEYLERAANHAYGPRDESGSRPDNANVRALRKQLEARAKGGNVDLFATRILGSGKSA